MLPTSAIDSPENPYHKFYLTANFLNLVKLQISNVLFKTIVYKGVYADDA